MKYHIKYYCWLFMATLSLLFFTNCERGILYDTGQVYTKNYIDASNKIVFCSDRSGDMDIYFMNSDGSNQVRLTYAYGQDRQPRWSPDGTMIAFISGRNGNSEIYIMDISGRYQKRLTWNDETDLTPIFSPDGTKIISERYTPQVGSIISITEIDGGTRNLVAGVHPSFAPDGRRIVYSYNGDLYIHWIDDSHGYEQLTTGTREDSYPIFLPDGQHVVFTGYDPEAGRTNLYIVDDNGHFQRLLAADIEPAEPPVISPDGSKIAFLSGILAELDLQQVNTDGTGQMSLCSGHRGQFNPDYSPDGNFVVFCSTHQGYSNIYIADAEGQNLKNLTENNYHDYEPKFSPVSD